METREPPRLGDLVRRHRVAAALSQEALAERAGLSVRGISDLERGVHRAPRLETVRMVAEALGLTDDERAAMLAAARPLVLRVDDPAPERSVGPAALPLPPTRLIGREQEIAELSDLLARDDVRLVTLTGAGGTGKTRLALAVAEQAAGDYRDGVCFVDLSALIDAALVMPTVATALGVREAAGESIAESVSRHLRNRRLLLVLDNCEQVLEAAPDIAGLLAACSGVVILTTSRVPLHIRAEREIAVAPLPLPEAGRLLPLVELAHIPTVALFVERAQAADARFMLARENATAIAEICQKLDGLPLAIELAAARVKVLPPHALLSRLEQRLALLTSGSRDLPARQQTMRTAIAWSYDLLHAEEQEVFRRLSVFAGGCTLAAAETVAGDDGTRDVLACVAALVDINLLRQVDARSGEPRFRMLETVREFGLEQLALAGETDVARARHAEYFVGLLEIKEFHSPRIFDLKGEAAFAADQDNFRLVLSWFEERDETDAMLRITKALYGLWLTHGPQSEGVEWLERTLKDASRTATMPRIGALAAAGRLAAIAGDYVRAATFVDEGLALAREHGDPFLIAQSLNNAGLLSYRLGQYPRADQQLWEAHQIVREQVDLGQDVGIEECFPLHLLGDVAMAQEQFSRAAAHYQEAIEIARKVGAVWGGVDTRIGLAGARLCTGSVTEAAALYAECLRDARDLGVTLLIASSLLGMAGVAAAIGLPEPGARLLGAAEGLAASAGPPLFPRDRPIQERCLAALTEALPAERLVAGREAGRLLTVDQAIAETQAITGRIS